MGAFEHGVPRFVAEHAGEGKDLPWELWLLFGSRFGFDLEWAIPGRIGGAGRLHGLSRKAPERLENGANTEVGWPFGAEGDPHFRSCGLGAEDGL